MSTNCDSHTDGPSHPGTMGIPHRIDLSFYF